MKAANEVAVRVPHPPDVLRDQTDLVPTTGAALDLACGAGAQAVWLATRGLTVDAVDVSTEGLRLGATLAERYDVGDAIRWLHADLDEGVPSSCAGPYAVVVCQRFRDPDLYRSMAGRLAPGGLLVVTVLSEVGGRPGRFRAAPGELSAALAELDLLVDVEAAGEASVVARRPFDA